MDSSNGVDSCIYNDEVNGTLTLNSNEEESEESPTTTSSETRVNVRNPINFQRMMEWCALMMMNSSCGKEKNGRCKYQKLTRGGRESAIRLVFGLYNSFLRQNRNVRVTARNKVMKIKKYDDFKKEIRQKFGIYFQVNVNSFRFDYRALYLYPDLHHYASLGIIRHRHIRYWEIISRELCARNTSLTSTEEFDIVLGIVKPDWKEKLMKKK